MIDFTYQISENAVKIKPKSKFVSLKKNLKQERLKINKKSLKNEREERGKRGREG